MKYLSLFSGIGGFELGIQQAYEEICAPDRSVIGAAPDAGCELPQRVQPPATTCIGCSEIDKYAIQIYERHFPAHRNYGDITTIDERGLPDFDLLVGGFPCQSFSIAGKRGGFGDTRGTLFFDICRLLKEKQPRLLLLENVKGLLSHGQGRTFYTIITTLDELGYDLQWQVLNSKDFGVPQNRERVFIIGNLRGTRRPEVFPFGGENEENINSFTNEPQRKEGYIATRHLGRNGKLLGTRSATVQASEVPHWTDGTKIRRLTPTECERLQGFPDGWTKGVSDTQRYKCLGNAVTVNVIREIAKKLI